MFAGDAMEAFILMFKFCLFSVIILNKLYEVVFQY